MTLTLEEAVTWESALQFLEQEKVNGVYQLTKSELVQNCHSRLRGND